MSRQTQFSKFVFLLTTVLLGILLSGCAPRSPTVVDLVLGQPAEVHGWTLTVHSVRWLTPDSYRQPSSGHGFLAVELTLENSTENISYVMPERQTLALGPDGESLQPHPSAGVLAAREQGWLVVQGEMGPGQVLTGAVSYELPLDLSGWRWVFRPQLLGSQVEAVLDLEGQTTQ